MGFGSILANPAIQLALGVGGGLAAGYADEREKRRKVQDERAKMDYQARLARTAATQKQELEEDSPLYMARVAAQEAQAADANASAAFTQQKSSDAMTSLQEQLAALTLKAEQAKEAEAAQKKAIAQKKTEQGALAKAREKQRKITDDFYDLIDKGEKDEVSPTLTARLGDLVKANPILMDNPMYERAAILDDTDFLAEAKAKKAEAYRSAAPQAPGAFGPQEASPMGAAAAGGGQEASPMGGPDPLAAPGSDPTREEAIQMLMAKKGMTYEEAAALADRLMQEASAMGGPAPAAVPAAAPSSFTPSYGVTPSGAVPSF